MTLTDQASTSASSADAERPAEEFRVGDAFEQPSNVYGGTFVVRIIRVPRRDRGEFHYTVRRDTRAKHHSMPMTRAQLLKLRRITEAEVCARAKQRPRIWSKIDLTPEPMMLVARDGMVMQVGIALDEALGLMRDAGPFTTVRRQRDGELMAVARPAVDGVSNLDMLECVAPLRMGE